MNFPRRAGRDFGRATLSLRHAQRAKPRKQRNPAETPLIVRGNLFRQPEPALSRANPPVISSARAQKIFREAAKCIKPRGDANSGQKRLNAQFEWIRRVLQKESLESLGEEFGNHPDFLTIVRYLYEGRLTHRNRALVILAHRHGISDRVISASLAINRHTVRRSREIFDLGGATALFGSKPKSNRKVDDNELATAIFGVLHEPPSNHGINRTSWTMAHLR